MIIVDAINDLQLIAADVTCVNAGDINNFDILKSIPSLIQMFLSQAGRTVLSTPLWIGNRRWCSATASPWSKPLRTLTNPMATCTEYSQQSPSSAKRKKFESCGCPGTAASWFKSETRLWSSSTQRPLWFVDPRYTHPPRRKEVIAHLSTLDCFIHDPTPRRRRGPPPKSRPNRNHPIPLRTPSPPPTLATYDRNFGDEQLPTLRGGRSVVWTSMAPMPCFHGGAWTPRPGEDLWWVRAPPMRIASAAENHLQAPSVTPTTTTVRRTILSMTFRVLYWTEISQQWQTDSFMNRN